MKLRNNNSTSIQYQAGPQYDKYLSANLKTDQLPQNNPYAFLTEMQREIRQPVNIEREKRKYEKKMKFEKL